MNLLQKLPALSKASKLTTTSGGSTKTTKEETTLDPNLANTSAH